MISKMRDMFKVLVSSMQDDDELKECLIVGRVLVTTNLLQGRCLFQELPYRG